MTDVDWPNLPAPGDAIPLDDEPDGAELLARVAEFIGRYVAFPTPHCVTAVTLWAAHTHAGTQFYVTPRLVLDSAEPGSGKTRVLEILRLLTHRPIMSISTTVAALYRRLGEEPRTVLLDETDALFGKQTSPQHEDLRALLNSGYKRGATVDRCVGDGAKMKVVEFPVFAPVALAGIAGNMPPTITTRSVTIHMRKRAPGETVEQFRERDAELIAEPLRGALAEWVGSIAVDLGDARPDMPEGVVDRPAEVWEALLAVADAAGGDWPKLGREACRYFVLDVDPGELSLGVRLLTDLREVFGDRDRLPTVDILAALVALDESPWADMWGKPLDARRLARELARYGVERTTFKTATGTAKGYQTTGPTGLLDAWSRYLPKSVTRATAVTPQVRPVTAPAPVTGESVTALKAVTPLTREVSPVTDVTGNSRAPKRVQVVKRNGKVVIPPGAIYVGRNMPGIPNDHETAYTEFGNPHVVGGTEGKRCRVPSCNGKVHDRAEAIAMYRQHLRDFPNKATAARRVLAGRDLGCWCPPELNCHADLLLAVANEGVEP